jgi:microcystin-dependent protein
MPTLINSFSLSSTVGIGTNTPNKNLTVIGEVSASRNLYIGGDINVYGTLYTYGSSVQLSSTNLTVGDPIIYIADNNNATNNPFDIGIVGHFNDSTSVPAGIGYQHTGLVRNKNTGTWTLFSGVTTEPINNTIAWNDPKFKIDTITANLSGGSFNTTNLTATNILSVNNIAGLGDQTVFSDGVNTNGNGFGTATLNYTNGIYGNASKYVLNGGNVGVGTSTPNYPLTVNGTVSASNFRAAQGIPSNVDLSLNGYSFGADGDTGMFSPSGVTFNTGEQNGLVAFYSNNVEVMRLGSGAAIGGTGTNKYVGIGTTSPNSSLTVVGNISATGSVYGNGTDITVPAGAPTGAIQAFAMNSAPTGWVAADGSTLNTYTYRVLHKAITNTYGGTAYSAGTTDQPGAITTFTLPDLRASFVRGAGSDGVATAGTFGVKQADALQGHQHSYYSSSGAGGYANFSSNSPQAITGNTSSLVSDGTNGTPRTAAETRPRNIAMLYCIKY